ncbi:hypothetical protein BDQ17DRAFT_107332 [Cyathus striatus]|nr:hypothetical protein BDQ17DRAFT_107332 [Cyathus striatus]
MGTEDIPSRRLPRNCPTRSFNSRCRFSLLNHLRRNSRRHRPHVFTFPLFTIGFLIPGVVQLILRWASGLSKEVPFASQAFWKAVIIVFMFFASVSVMAAITILNATIFLLKPGLPSDAGDMSEAPTDTVSEIPGIIAFAFSGIIFLLFFICIVLSMVVRGPKVIMKLLIQVMGRLRNWISTRMYKISLGTTSYVPSHRRLLRVTLHG